jgi:gas vesicle protein
MKKILFASVLSTIFVSLTLMSCNNEPPKSALEKKTENFSEAAKDLGNEVAESTKTAGEDLKDEAHNMKEDLAKTRKQFKEDIETSIEKINKKIAETDKKMEKAAKSQKEAWAKEKKDLIAARDRLNENLKDVGSDMKDGWNEFAANVKKTLKDVNEKINQ